RRGRSVDDRHEIPAEAVEAKEPAEEAARAEQQRMASLLRAAADRREGMARLASQVASARSRVDVTSAEIVRLKDSDQSFDANLAADRQSFESLSQELAERQEAEAELNSGYEDAGGEFHALQHAQRVASERERELSVRVSGLTSRLEALKLNAQDDSSAELLAAHGELLLVRLGELISTTDGYEKAISTILRDSSEALVAS